MNIADRESKDNTERAKNILKHSGTQPVAEAAVPEKAHLVKLIEPEECKETTPDRKNVTISEDQH